MAESLLDEIRLEPAFQALRRNRWAVMLLKPEEMKETVDKAVIGFTVTIRHVDPHEVHHLRLHKRFEARAAFAGFGHQELAAFGYRKGFVGNRLGERCPPALEDDKARFGL